MRRKYKADLPVLSEEFRTLLSDGKQKIKCQMLKVRSVNGPDVKPPDEVFKDMIFHEQDVPLVCITFDIEPMNLDIYNAYCPRQEQLS